MISILSKRAESIYPDLVMYRRFWMDCRVRFGISSITINPIPSIAAMNRMMITDRTLNVLPIIHCAISGSMFHAASISFIEALEHNLFGSEGLFTKKYFKDQLPLYMMEIFSVEQWIGIVEWEELLILVKSDRDLRAKIKTGFVNRADIKRKISALNKFVKDSKIPALECMFNITPSVFRNQLTLFISDALQKYAQYKAVDITAEQLVHKVLFNEANHELCRVVKICVDVGWHWQRYEEYAETVAKIVGIKYNDMSMRLEFDKLRIAVLDSMWLPSLKQQKNLIRDVVLQGEVEGIRCCKTWSRAMKEKHAFMTLENESEEMALPYK